MPRELWIDADKWDAVVEAVTGERDWRFVSSTSQHGDLVHEIPTTLRRHVCHTVGDVPVEKETLLLLRMVGNGTLLEDRATLEIRFQGLRLLSIAGHPGYFVQPDTPETRARLARWSPKLRRQPPIPKPWIVAEPEPAPRRKRRKKKPAPAAKPPGYTCRAGHVHDRAERDPINDAFFCVTCGDEIPD